MYLQPPAMTITCQLHHFEARCRQRCYPLDEAMACIVNRSGDTITVDTDSPAYPRDRNPSPAEQARINQRLDAGAEAMHEAGCGCSPPLA